MGVRHVSSSLMPWSASHNIKGMQSDHAGPSQGRTVLWIPQAAFVGVRRERREGVEDQKKFSVHDGEGKELDEQKASASFLEA